MVVEVMRSWLRSLAHAILGKVRRKPDRLDAATRMAMDADLRGKRERLSLVVRERLQEIDQIEELQRALEKDECARPSGC